MDRILRQPDYAEDQPHSHAILTTHVLHRGVTVGSLLGVLYGGGRYAFSARARTAPLAVALVRSSAVGVVASTGLSALALWRRMYGREEIEWQDRAWRLLENKGQNRVDEWSCLGAIVAGIVGGANTRAALGWKGVVGSMGIGSAVGVAGFGAYRFVSSKGRAGGGAGS